MEASSDIKETGRVEAFSDGVFAIAITLLVLDIKVPHLEPGSSKGLAELLLEQWPSYVAYVVSFLIISVMWINHHHMFRLIARTDNIFLFTNSLLLMTITFLNFSTALLADYIEQPDARIAALVYAGTGVIIAVLYNILWRYGSARLLSKNANPKLVAQITYRYQFGPIMYLLAFGLAFISVPASIAVQATMAVFFALVGLNDL